MFFVINHKAMKPLQMKQKTTFKENTKSLNGDQKQTLGKPNPVDQ